MKMCIHYLLRRCEFVIMLKFALIIPLSCKAMMYICSMENAHANINFMLYLCYVCDNCLQYLASGLCPWPQPLASSILVPAAGPSRWPLASNLEPSLSQLLGARDQARMSLHRRLLNTKSRHQLKVVHDTSKHSSLFHQLQNDISWGLSGLRW